MTRYEYGFLTKMAESGASEDDIAKVYALLKGLSKNQQAAISGLTRDIPRSSYLGTPQVLRQIRDTLGDPAAVALLKSKGKDQPGNWLWRHTNSSRHQARKIVKDYIAAVNEMKATRGDVAKLVRPQAKRFHKEPGVREIL